MSPAFNSSSSITAPAAGRPAGRGLASPWSHVVRGEADAATTVPSLHSRPELVDRSLPSGLAPESLSSSSIVSLRPPEVATEEQGSGGNAAGKKVWNILNNGDSEGGAVMGATWPELSESAKSFAKPTFSESVVVPDGSEIPHEVPLMAPPKTTFNNPNPNSNPSPAVPARQKSIPKSNSIKRSGSGANGSPLSHQQSFTPEITPIALEEGSGSSPNGPSKGSNWEPNRDGGLAAQHQGEDDHRGGFYRNRRGNNSGGGGFHRGGVGWNSPRGFNNRDPRMPMSIPPVQQRGYSRQFVQPPPPPPPTPFIGMPPHVRSIVAPMGYPDVHSHVYYMPPPAPIDPLRNVPFIPHQAPQAMASTVYIAPVEHLRSMVLKQIEYYFSFENLLKDTYLRQKMDDQGWVPISLIAGFNRVKQLRNDIPFILESLRGSTVVEIQGEKIRRRNDWMNWILPSIPQQHGIVSHPQYSLTSNVDLILAHVQNLGLSESGSGSVNAIGKVSSSAGSIVS